MIIGILIGVLYFVTGLIIGEIITARLKKGGTLEDYVASFAFEVIYDAFFIAWLPFVLFMLADNAFVWIRHKGAL